ncbi:MAG: methyltransferase domain-containing protein [candidate division WOR-3 bacterium]
MNGLFHYYEVPRFREIAFLLWPLLFLKLATEKAALRAIKALSPSEIMEIGGGWGKFARRVALLLPGARVISVDSEPAMTRVASRHNNLKNLIFITGDFYRLEHGAECVLLSGLFVLLWPRELAIFQLWKLTGRAAVVTLTGSTCFTRALRLFHRLTTGLEIHTIEPEEFIRLAESCGFACEIIPVHGFERSYVAILRKSEH